MDLYEYDSDDTFGSGQLRPWEFDTRCMTHVKTISSYKRGILRLSQKYDPFVDTALKDFNADLRTNVKGYTRAPGDEWALREKLLRYDKPPRALKLSDPLFRSAYAQAVAEVTEEFKLDAPVVPHWILDVDLVPSTSSGFPHFKRKNSIMDQIKQEGRFHLHHLKLYDLHRCPLLPCTIGTRGSLSEASDPKTRLVWMYPGAMTACEAVFAQPLIEKIYSQKRELLLTGVETKHRIQQFLGLISDEQGFAGVGLDFKAFDTLRVNQLTYDAFAILKQNIKFGWYYDKKNGLCQGRSGVDRRAEKAFDNIVEYFVHTPMLLPNGRVVTKHTGIPSGSHFTNLIDSIINRILIKTFGYCCGINITQLKTNGDDSSFRVADTHAPTILERARVFFDRYYGMTVSVEKSCVAFSPAEMHVSGTTWNNARPHRPTLEWFRLAAYSDTYIRVPFDSFQRLLGLGIAGAFRDPEFVRFFDHFQRGYDCSSGPAILSWTKLRWLEKAFGIEDLPLVYKQGARSLARLRLLIA